jgi:hypothetical protein
MHKPRKVRAQGVASLAVFLPNAAGIDTQLGTNASHGIGPKW